MLQYDVSVTSPLYADPTPKAAWIVSIQQSCDKKYNDWIKPNFPVRVGNYDIRKPPLSPVIANFVYSGPLVTTCGEPELHVVSSDGLNLDFITATFNSTTGNITI